MEELKSINNQLTKIELKIETETDHTMEVLSESHSMLNRKLDEIISLENQVEIVENKVSPIEYTMKKAEKVEANTMFWYQLLLYWTVVGNGV